MAYVKKVPLRKCAGCQEMKDKKELIRILRTPEGEVRIDLTGRANGRGVYLCRSSECLKTAQKKGSLSRSLKVPVEPEVYEQLLKEIEKIEE